MVKLIPDSQSVKEILKSVKEVIRLYTYYNERFQIIGLHPTGRIEWYQNWSSCNSFHALPLATYTRTKQGIQADYEQIVQKDSLLLAQFEEALKVALLNSSSAVK